MQNQNFSNSINTKSFFSPQGLEKLFCRIEALLKERDIVTISIDGMCGGGKTTLAGLLLKKYAANVFHADSFFLQPHQRTAERLSEIGGNLDFERLKVEVLASISRGGKFEYRHFSCGALNFSENISVSPKKLNIIEGSYIQNPRLDFSFDINVFICTSMENQEARILKRNGKLKLEEYKNIWIPKENAYFKHFGIKEKSDIIIET